VQFKGTSTGSGTTVYNLGVDSSGNLVTNASPVGGASLSANQITGIWPLRNANLTIPNSTVSSWWSADLQDGLNNSTVHATPLPAGTYTNFWFHWFPGITVNAGTNIWAIFKTNDVTAFVASITMSGATDKRFFLSGASVVLATNGTPCTWQITNDSSGSIAGGTMVHGSFTRIGQ